MNQEYTSTEVSTVKMLKQTTETAPVAKLQEWHNTSAVTARKGTKRLRSRPNGERKTAREVKSLINKKFSELKSWANEIKEEQESSRKNEKAMRKLSRRNSSELKGLAQETKKGLEVGNEKFTELGDSIHEIRTAQDAEMGAIEEKLSELGRQINSSKIENRVFLFVVSGVVFFSFMLAVSIATKILYPALTGVIFFLLCVMYLAAYEVRHPAKAASAAVNPDAAMLQ
jgi:hypothetical protein